MKIEKYLLYLPASVRVASKRLDIPVLNNFQLALLYLIRSHYPVKTKALFRICQDAKLTDNYPFLCTNVSILAKYELVEVSHALYSLTPKGRDYLSYIRRYLLHKRL